MVIIRIQIRFFFFFFGLKFAFLKDAVIFSQEIVVCFGPASL